MKPTPQSPTAPKWKPEYPRSRGVRVPAAAPNPHPTPKLTPKIMRLLRQLAGELQPVALEATRISLEIRFPNLEWISIGLPTCNDDAPHVTHTFWGHRINDE